MKIREKTNVKLYLISQDDDCYILSNCDTFDFIDDTGLYDGYMYILPFKKANFEFRGQDQELQVFVEKVDEKIKQVYVSQTHWLFMRNIIENRLGLPVKILKRYPGKLTVAQVTVPGQEVNKTAIKALAEEMKEKIFIKFTKF